MFEVDSLAAGDQLERRFAIEVEMPEVAQQPDFGPVSDAGQKRIHQHDAVDLGGILRGISVSDHQPDIVASDAHALMSKRGGESMDVLRHCLLVVASSGFCGLSESAQIGRDDCVRLGKLGDQRQPHVARLCVAMQKDDRLTLAGCDIVNPRTVDLSEAPFRGLRESRARKRRHCHK
jgi:hypothetical protein